jgi:hypothetical protein
MQKKKTGAILPKAVSIPGKREISTIPNGDRVLLCYWFII